MQIERKLFLIEKHIPGLSGNTDIKAVYQLTAAVCKSICISSSQAPQDGVARGVEVGLLTLFRILTNSFSLIIIGNTHCLMHIE